MIVLAILAFVFTLPANIYGAIQLAEWMKARKESRKETREEK